MMNTGKQAEEQRAYGTHGERGRGGKNDFFLGYAKLVSQCIEEKNYDEEIERVERPAEEPGEHCVMRT